jgi:hypothetical protein
VEYGICDIPTGTHNLGMLFSGNHVESTLGGTDTADGYRLDNTAGLNTNWSVTWRDNGCVHLTFCVSRLDAQNNVSAYIDTQFEDVTLDAGTGSTQDIWTWNSYTVAFAGLPSPAGNGSSGYCTNCTQAKPTTNAGSGAFVVREAGQWNGL